MIDNARSTLRRKIIYEAGPGWENLLVRRVKFLLFPRRLGFAVSRRVGCMGNWFSFDVFGGNSKIWQGGFDG